MAESAPAAAAAPQMKSSYVAKVPKGTRDIDPLQSVVRERVLGLVTDVFKRHGAVTIETPVFELKDTLTGKYGEDSKLIYDLADQGGEICSLRYDLTVPFARYVGQNNIQSMKRYQIGKVYRRDNPLMGRGKYREFYQCDFDIAGQTDTMIAEAECVKMMTEILSVLEVGNFLIKLNHRQLLDGIFAVAGVPEEKFRAICSAVDKLDKASWEEVRKEMVETKGLDAAAADIIASYVLFKGTPEQVVAKLRDDAAFKGVPSALAAVDEMELLFSYLKSLNVTIPRVSFDLSLARGLDYYTGIIYEAVLIGDGQELGSVAGGGRYDNLVGIFSSRTVPCVGFSVGIERLFGILEKNAIAKGAIRKSPTQVMIVSIGPGMLSHRLELANELWAANIRAELLYRTDAKTKQQLDYASHNEIPFAAIFGGDEIANGTVGIKNLSNGQQDNVPRAELIAYLKNKLGGGGAAAAPSSAAAAGGAAAAAAPAAAAPAAASSSALVPAAPATAAAAGGEEAKGGDKKQKAKAKKLTNAPVARPEYLDHRIKMFDEIHAKQQEEIKRKAAEKTAIKVTLPNGSVVDGIAFETTPMKIALDISQSLGKRAMIAKVDGATWDLVRPLEKDCNLEICDFNTKEGKETFWHSTAHMMGEALELQYGVHLCIGPCNGTDQGFFYDSYMGDRVVSDADYKTVEDGVAKVASAKQPYQRVIITREEALEIFKYNKFKCELIRKFAEAGTTMTAYRCGDLVDLCRGPHIPNTQLVKAMMVTNHGQAYWLGDNKNESLQRLYGISFPDKPQMDEFKHFLQEAKKRDHRKLGIEYDLFFFDALSPGSCFFLPNGARIYNGLCELMRSEYRKRGFKEVISPNMYNMKLWEISGHAANYRENMFLFDVEGQEFGLKPMNCPGHCLMFKHRARSYRELPLRLADFGVIHRNEYSGALTGLTRVRRFQQDDAHIFCMPDQVGEEMQAAIDFIKFIYGIFGFEFTLELSTRPEKYLGELAVWDAAEKALAEALDNSGMKWKENPGDGAFYGPKIDIQVMDALRRKHQCATIQLDFQLPIRFDLEFMTGDAVGEATSRTQRPVMIHRAILGSVERMISILTEHYGGKWPFWISPRQVMIIPVGASNVAYAQGLVQQLQQRDFYAECDLTNRQLPKKIREAQLQHWNYIIVVGDNEVRDGTVAVRARQEGENDTDVDMGVMSFGTFVERISHVRETRSAGKIQSEKAAPAPVEAAAAAAAPAAAEM